MNVNIIGNKVFVNGSPLPPIPGAKSSVSLSQVGNRLSLSKEEESVVSVIISFSVLLLLVGVIIAAPHCMQIAFATKQRLADRRWSYAKVAVRKCRSL